MKNKILVIKNIFFKVQGFTQKRKNLNNDWNWVQYNRFEKGWLKKIVKTKDTAQTDKNLYIFNLLEMSPI